MTDTPDLRLYRQRRMDPLAVLERHFAPEVLQALDAYVRELADEVAAARPIKPWLTVAEAADMLGCSEAAVRKRHGRGRLRGRYQGARLYIETQSILDLAGYHAATTNQVAPARLAPPEARPRKDTQS